MQTLTCPTPNNINPLQNNGFFLWVDKIPTVSFFCNEVSLPGIDLPAAEIHTPLSLTPISGDKITFGELNVQFLINEDMSNYIKVHDWLIGLAFPESHQQYQNFISSNIDKLKTTPLLASYSDGILQILGSNNVVIKTVSFIDLLPVSLSTSESLRSTDGNTTYITGRATFRYSYYKFL